MRANSIFGSASIPILFAIGLSACSTAENLSIYRSFTPVETENSDTETHSILIDAQQRAILSTPLPASGLAHRLGEAEQGLIDAYAQYFDDPNIGADERVAAYTNLIRILNQSGTAQLRHAAFCAEPSPDVMASYAGSYGLGALFGGPQTDARVAASLASAVNAIRRSSTVQMLRDGMFRACEAYLNGADRGEYSEFMYAYLDATVTLLAIEQLAQFPPPSSGGSFQARVESAVENEFMSRLGLSESGGNLDRDPEPNQPACSEGQERNGASGCAASSGEVPQCEQGQSPNAEGECVATETNFDARTNEPQHAAAEFLQDATFRSGDPRVPDARQPVMAISVEENNVAEGDLACGNGGNPVNGKCPRYGASAACITGHRRNDEGECVEVAGYLDTQVNSSTGVPEYTADAIEDIVEAYLNQRGRADCYRRLERFRPASGSSLYSAPLGTLGNPQSGTTAVDAEDRAFMAMLLGCLANFENRGKFIPTFATRAAGNSPAGDIIRWLIGENETEGED